jgi:hypothetical protein
MIITTKRVTSKNDTPPDTDSKTQVEVQEKKAPGFKEKITRTSTSSVTTSSNSGKKPLVSPKIKKQVEKGVKQIKEGISDSVAAIKGTLK